MSSWIRAKRWNSSREAATRQTACGGCRSVTDCQPTTHSTGRMRLPPRGDHAPEHPCEQVQLGKVWGIVDLCFEELVQQGLDRTGNVFGIQRRTGCGQRDHMAPSWTETTVGISGTGRSESPNAARSPLVASRDRSEESTRHGSPFPRSHTGANRRRATQGALTNTPITRKMDHPAAIVPTLATSHPMLNRRNGPTKRNNPSGSGEARVETRSSRPSTRNGARSAGASTNDFAPPVH